MVVPGAFGGEERALNDPGAGVSGGCELLFEWWESNSGPLGEQPVRLTAEPSLQLLHFY